MKKYYRFIPALLALGWLGCAAQRPAPRTAAYPDSPARFELPTFRPDSAPQTVAADTPPAELDRIIRSRDATQKRLEAVERLTDLKKTSRDADYITYAQTLVRCADQLLAGKDEAAFRRYGVYTLFAEAYSRANASLPEASGDAREWALWQDVAGLRDRGLRDSDQKLREYFERYVPLEKEPDWKEESARLRDVTEKIIKDLPQYAADLRARLALADSAQEPQLTILKRITEDLEAKDLTPELHAQFIQASRQQIAYRLHTLWANLYARNIIEAIGADNARAYGLSPAEVKLGWPQYTRPAPAQR